MKVSLLIGANAYACIAENGRKIDIRLSPGKSAPASLREYASGSRDRAAAILERAAIADRAAHVLETDGYGRMIETESGE